MTILGLLLLTLSIAIVTASANSEHWPFGVVIGLSVSVAIPFTVPTGRKWNRLAAWLVLLPLIYVLAFGPYVAALNAYTGKPWHEYDTTTTQVIFPGHIYILELPQRNRDTALYSISVGLKDFSSAWRQFGFNVHWFVDGFASEIAACKPTRTQSEFLNANQS